MRESCVLYNHRSVLSFLCSLFAPSLWARLCPQSHVCIPSARHPVMRRAHLSRRPSLPFVLCVSSSSICAPRHYRLHRECQCDSSDGMRVMERGTTTAADDIAPLPRRPTVVVTVDGRLLFGSPLSLRAFCRARCRWSGGPARCYTRPPPLFRGFHNLFSFSLPPLIVLTRAHRRRRLLSLSLDISLTLVSVMLHPPFPSCRASSV